MPEGNVTPQGAPPAGGASPPGGQGTGPGAATQPVANRGQEGMALAALAVVVQGLQSRILPLLPASSDAAADVREALNKLAKHVPPGAVSQGVQMTQAQRDLMQQRQTAMQQATQRAAAPAQQAPPQQPQMAA